MRTWSVVMFFLLSLTAAMNVLRIGFGTYTPPHTPTRSSDAIVLLFTLAVLVWGACVLW